MKNSDKESDFHDTGLQVNLAQRKTIAKREMTDYAKYTKEI